MSSLCTTIARGSFVEFGKTVVFFVIVLDPFGLMPLVAALTARGGAGRLILRITLSATVLLLLFTVAGTWVLDLMGVTLNDMRVGGGLLLLAFALKLLLQGGLVALGEEGYQAAVVPLISPLLVGPGAITAAIVLAAVHGVLTTVLAVRGGDVDLPRDIAGGRFDPRRDRGRWSGSGKQGSGYIDRRHCYQLYTGWTRGFS